MSHLLNVSLVPRPSARPSARPPGRSEEGLVNIIAQNFWALSNSGGKQCDWFIGQLESIETIIMGAAHWAWSSPVTVPKTINFLMHYNCSKLVGWVDKCMHLPKLTSTHPEDITNALYHSAFTYTHRTTTVLVCLVVHTCYGKMDKQLGKKNNTEIVAGDN